MNAAKDFFKKVEKIAKLLTELFSKAEAFTSKSNEPYVDSYAIQLNWKASHMQGRTTHLLRG